MKSNATVGFEALDYFSSGGLGKSQLDQNLMSSKRHGNVQNQGREQQSNIGSEFRCFDGGMMGDRMIGLGQVVERPPPQR